MAKLYFERRSNLFMPGRCVKFHGTSLVGLWGMYYLTTAAQLATSQEGLSSMNEWVIIWHWWILEYYHIVDSILKAIHLQYYSQKQSATEGYVSALALQALRLNKLTKAFRVFWHLCDHVSDLEVQANIVLERSALCWRKWNLPFHH
jgi:hypothetical protein